MQDIHSIRTERKEMRDGGERALRWIARCLLLSSCIAVEFCATN
jgi:hypothetical protein